MTIRTTEITVTFLYPFMLGAMHQEQPAGTYRVVSDDEEIPDLSTLATRRIASYLHTPAINTAGRGEVYAVQPSDLAKAQAEDARHAQAVMAERSKI